MVCSHDRSLEKTIWRRPCMQHAGLPVGVRKATLAAFQVVWWVEPVVQGHVALAASVTEGGDLMEPACNISNTRWACAHA